MQLFLVHVPLQGACPRHMPIVLNSIWPTCSSQTYDELCSWWGRYHSIPNKLVSYESGSYEACFGSLAVPDTLVSCQLEPGWFQPSGSYTVGGWQRVQNSSFSLNMRSNVGFYIQYGKELVKLAASWRGRSPRVAQSCFTHFLHVRVSETLANYVVLFGPFCSNPRVLRGTFCDLSSKTSYFTLFSSNPVTKTSYFTLFLIGF